AREAGRPLCPRNEGREKYESGRDRRGEQRACDAGHERSPVHHRITSSASIVDLPHIRTRAAASKIICCRSRRAGAMPANLSPEYKTAEAAYRKAREPRERLDCLREMLRTIPKHKGTERLQADIKARIKELGDEIDVGRRGGGHGGPALVIR